MLRQKEVRGKVGGLARSPPTVAVNKASLNMGLLKIHTKAEEDHYLFSLRHTHTLTNASSSLISKHLHMAGYRRASL